jgi:outer membrane protein assembly factor BamB
LAVPVVALLATISPAQEREKLFSCPDLPSREVLDRLNLKMAWKHYVPMDGRRDGFASIQIDGNDVIAQTRSGLVTLLDAETGKTRWRTRVGKPYRPTLPLAFNSRSIFVINNAYLYALDRANGNTQWEFYLLIGGISAAPVADETYIFLSTSETRLYAYRLPFLGQADGAKPGADGKPAPTTPPPAPPPVQKDSYRSSDDAPPEPKAGLRPFLDWDAVTNLRLELPAVLSRDAILVASPSGSAKAFAKVPKEERVGAEVFRFSTDGDILAPPGVYEDVAYLGSADSNVYAINISSGKTYWRFTGGNPITRQPIATEKDVFVVADRNGMSRLDREKGDSLWRIPRGRQTLTSNPEADRFLATNPKFVYAADSSGRLLVLDRQRGTELSRFDVRDYVFPVMNNWTDRLYLAANDGLIVCLHDKEYDKPYLHRKPVEVTKPPVDAGKLIKERLETTLVTHPGGEEVPLKQLLTELAEKYKFQYQLTDQVWVQKQLPPVSEKPVKHPKVENVPLKKVLEDILAQVDAKFELAGGLLIILPKPKAP